MARDPRKLVDIQRSSKLKSKPPNRWARSSWQNLNRKRKTKNVEPSAILNKILPAGWGKGSFPFPQWWWGRILCLESSSRLFSARETNTLKRVQWKYTKMVKELEHLSCEETLKGLGTFNLNRRLRNILNNVKIFEWKE